MSSKKIFILFGTRPEIIRLSEIINNSENLFDVTLINTNQNFDINLNKIFIKSLLPNKKIINLNCKNENIAIFMSEIFKKLYLYISKNKPDGLLVLGDTNSALGSLLFKKIGIKVFHMEAGNRCFDELVPEEINRKIIDKIADYNLVYTDSARMNLLLEGYHPSTICKTGSPLREVTNKHFHELKKNKILQNLKLEKGKYFVVSFHRKENLTNKQKIDAIIESIVKISKNYNKEKIVISFHPHAKKIISKSNLNKLKRENILINKPMNYFDYLKLQTESKCVISDSGSVSEESYMLNFKSILLRDSTERPDAIDAGTITTINFSNFNKHVIQIIDELKTEEGTDSKINDYDIKNCSKIALKFIYSKI